MTSYYDYYFNINSKYQYQYQYQYQLQLQLQLQQINKRLCYPLVQQNGWQYTHIRTQKKKYWSGLPSKDLKLIYLLLPLKDIGATASNW